MAYRRKPDTVDAWVYATGGPYPSWLQTAMNQSNAEDHYGQLDVQTPDGQQTAFVGDYVTRDTVTGALGAVPSSAFDAKWEAIP